MKYLRLIASIIIFVVGIFSCNEPKTIAEFDTAVVETLIRNEKRYNLYAGRNLNFNSSAVYLNEHDSIINAMNFFESVCFDSFFPLKAKNANQFKLVKVPNWPNKNIYEWVSGHGFWGIDRERLKGLSLFTKAARDVNGNPIDSNDLKDKHVFVKFWFIHCVACIAEMPELNKIVEEYKDRKDIAFISFATDEREKLLEFLQKTNFNYRLISYHDAPGIDSLHIKIFPTHLYVKGNKIQRVIKAEEIRSIISQL